MQLLLLFHIRDPCILISRVSSTLFQNLPISLYQDFRIREVSPRLEPIHLKQKLSYSFRRQIFFRKPPRQNFQLFSGRIFLWLFFINKVENNPTSPVSDSPGRRICRSFYIFFKCFPSHQLTTFAYNYLTTPRVNR